MQRLVTDSRYTDEWVLRQWQLNPCRRVEGGILTGPVRGSYCNLLTPNKRDLKQKGKEKYGLVCLFPPGVDIKLLIDEAVATARTKWPTFGTPGGPKLYNPMRDQDMDGRGQPGEAERNKGYVKGGIRIGANSNRPVKVVDLSNRPIEQPSEVYSGAWYLPILNCYNFDADGNKGPSFGLQAIMKFADDDDISGSGSNINTAEAFASVRLEGGDINPEAAFAAGDGNPFAINSGFTAPAGLTSSGIDPLA